MLVILGAFSEPEPFWLAKRLELGKISIKHNSDIPDEVYLAGDSFNRNEIWHI